MFEDVPHFAITAPDAKRIWWQISADRDFREVPPNFDEVGDLAAEVKPRGSLDGTFLSPDRDWFFRAKVRRGGVWSDWSAPVAFQVKKPRQPRIEGVERLADGTARVKWPRAVGEMLVFGSDRLDFLPEIFGDREPTVIENNTLRESRPNRNQLATVPASAGEAVVPARAFYRLIARDGKAFSVPSALRRLPGAPAKVLQNRHEKAPGALTGRDIAVEMALP